MRKTTVTPGELLRSGHIEKRYLGKTPLKIVPAQQKQTVHRGKVDPGVSELPRDHVNRP